MPGGDPTSPIAAEQASSEAVTQQQFAIDALRIRLGFWTIIGGFILAALAILFSTGALVASWYCPHPPTPAIGTSEVVAIVGSVTGVIGTVVGAFLGSNIGASGRTQDRHERGTITRQALDLAGALDPKVAAKILGTANE